MIFYDDQSKLIYITDTSCSDALSRYATNYNKFEGHTLHKCSINLEYFFFIFFCSKKKWSYQLRNFRGLEYDKFAKDQH